MGVVADSVALVLAGAACSLGGFSIGWLVSTVMRHRPKRRQAKK